jgi:DNA-binding CsgD family transcriptional regulator
MTDEEGSATPLTHEELTESPEPRRAPLDVRVDFVRNSDGRIVTDKRWVTRKAKERARREKMIRDKREKTERENAVLAIAAGGASYGFIAKELGISESTARRLYNSGMDRVGKEDTKEFLEQMDHRHAVLLQSVWTGALQNKGTDRMEALRIMDQWMKLRGAYPAAGVDVTGTVVHEHNSTQRISLTLLNIQNQRERRSNLASEEDAVDAPPEYQGRSRMNGFGEGAPRPNGNGSAELTA